MWCASAQIMDPIVVNNLLTRNETKTTETKIGPRADESNRQTRQLDSSVWSPIPAVWDPRPQSPLNTWWALPWPFNGGQSLVRIAPPSPYWEDYPHHDMGHHHHHHQHVSSNQNLTLNFWGRNIYQLHFVVDFLIYSMNMNITNIMNIMNIITNLILIYHIHFKMGKTLFTQHSREKHNAFFINISLISTISIKNWNLFEEKTSYSVLTIWINWKH